MCHSETMRLRAFIAFVCALLLFGALKFAKYRHHRVIKNVGIDSAFSS